MAVNYSVQAEVVDIRQDKPRPGDSFLVDTQVWLWVTYTKATGNPNQVRRYPVYVSQARHAGAKLFWCGLSLAEVAHQIEVIEREIFVRSNPQHGPIKPKEFRHNFPAGRANVVAEVRAAWAMVSSMASSIATTIDEPAAATALTRFQTQPLDGYDLFMLEAATKAGIGQILSDDGDFSTVPNIRVFTANDTVISRARASGKLVHR